MNGRIEQRISILNPELAEDKFTMQLINEHDSEKMLWQIWLICLGMTFFLLVI